MHPRRNYDSPSTLNFCGFQVTFLTVGINFAVQRATFTGPLLMAVGAVRAVQTSAIPAHVVNAT
jgi:hypothetical protein